MWLAGIQGVSFGVATAAGITVAIDVTPSTRRSVGNMVFAWMGRVGMLIGIGVGGTLFTWFDARTVLYASFASGLLAVLLAMRVDLSFRAPIGVSVFNLDRFLLPRAWLPALNLMLLSFVPGVLLFLSMHGDGWSVLALLFLVCLTVPAVRDFVLLSEHCQRGTANTTCLLATETGLLFGCAVACRLNAYLSAVSLTVCLHQLAATAFFVSLVMFVTVTYPYFKRKRVR